MGKTTGMLEVLTPEKIETYSWNGVKADRDAARAEFEKRMQSGMYLATVTDSPGHRSQVRTFDEVEQIEQTRGQVEVQISPALAGG